VITVEATESEFHVRIPKEDISKESLDRWIDWLELSRVAAKSKLSDEEADKIAEEIKANWWEANQGRFIPENQR
jgi:hypothetical protein